MQENELYVIPYYLVGSILEFDREMDMSSIYGGTWELFGIGRQTICIDPDDSDFNEVLKTGGSKTHTQTTDEMPSHAHTGKTGAAKVLSDILRIVKGEYDTVDNKAGNHAPATPHKNVTFYDVPKDSAGIPGGNHYHNVTTNDAGKGDPMDILNPYIVVYRYHKIAD